MYLTVLAESEMNVILAGCKMGPFKYAACFKQVKLCVFFIYVVIFGSLNTFLKTQSAVNMFCLSSFVLYINAVALLPACS